ncbi:hypothetical protein ABIT13_21135, partial [Limnospira fusiformis NRMCF6962]
HLIYHGWLGSWVSLRFTQPTMVHWGSWVSLRFTQPTMVHWGSWVSLRFTQPTMGKLGFAALHLTYILA